MTQKRDYNIWIIYENEGGAFTKCLAAAKEISKNEPILFHSQIAPEDLDLNFSTNPEAIKLYKNLFKKHGIPDIVIFKGNVWAGRDSNITSQAVKSRLVTGPNKKTTSFICSHEPNRSELKHIDLFFNVEKGSYDNPETENKEFILLGTPSYLTPDYQKACFEKWKNDIKHPGSICSIMLGDHNLHLGYSEEIFTNRNEDFVEKLVKYVKGGNFDTTVINTSPRTSGEFLYNIQTALKKTDINVVYNLYRDFTGSPPLPESRELLAAYTFTAKTIIVTSDSRSMMSEACGTGKPVEIAKIHPFTDNYDYLFAREMAIGKHAKIFDGDYTEWQPKSPPYNINAMVAEKILEVHDQKKLKRKDFGPY